MNAGGAEVGRRLAGLGFLLLAIGCAGGEESLDALQGVVVIDVDTLRADHLGAYGYGRDTSPAIDELAQRSIVFEWAFAQAPNTPPSQASIFSGLYPSSHGRIGDKDVLSDETTTLAESLSVAGYATAAFVDGGFMSPGFGMEQGFDVYDSGSGRGFDEIVPKALSWLRRHRHEPFFLLVHTYEVHAPYGATGDHRERFVDPEAVRTPGLSASVAALEAIRRSRWKVRGRLPPADLDYLMALYDGGIRGMDDGVRRILEGLETMGLRERTLIALISDHGEEFEEHGSVLHEKLYSPVARVPLVIHDPMLGGRRIAAPVETLDLMPTLLERLGVAIPDGVQGQSLLAAMRGRDSAPDLAVSESPFFGRSRAITDGKHRLLRAERRGSFELFDLETDPLELRPLAGRPELAEPLLRGLDRWRAAVAARRPASAEPSDLDPAVERRLRALGYLDDG